MRKEELVHSASSISIISLMNIVHEKSNEGVYLQGAVSSYDSISVPNNSMWAKMNRLSPLLLGAVCLILMNL
jgi:hypothetical protein